MTFVECGRAGAVHHRRRHATAYGVTTEIGHRSGRALLGEADRAEQAGARRYDRVAPVGFICLIASFVLVVLGAGPLGR